VSRNIASSSSFTSGRKIDLLVANEDGDELAFCEFKANNNKTLIQHQQSKSLRLNQQILMKMKKRSLNEQLFFFNGKGNFGRFVVLEETGEIYCSRPSSAFIVSHNILQLDDDTIKAFISWKKHLLLVNKKLVAASNKPEREDVGIYPNTCFTIVNKKE
ncbi:hypothetical protein CU098_001439, partial [Rhizopus stolonifer]